MNNFLISVKRFLKNKNTVTIICIIIILVILYVVYKGQIDSAVNPVNVPVAAVDIQPRTELKEGMINTISVPTVALTTDAIRYSSAVVGKYTNINRFIPKGSMFFQSQIVDKSSLPDSAFAEVKEGEIPYQFSVSMDTTYGNSIYPGSKVDIYMKAVDADDKIMVGRLLQDVEVIAVKDSSGKNVFDQESGTPSYLLFGVPDSIHILLRKCEYLSSYGVSLFPVPHGGTTESEGEITVDIQYLVDFINAATVDLSTEETEVTNGNG